MRYLTSVVETYRLPNDEAVKVFLEELKRDPAFTITKYSSTKKERKEKGDVVDEWVRFTVTKVFNEEKEPDSVITISYNKEY